MRTPQKLTNEWENLRTAGLVTGLKSTANPAMQKLLKRATKIHALLRTPEGLRVWLGRGSDRFLEECIGS